MEAVPHLASTSRRGASGAAGLALAVCLLAAGAGQAGPLPAGQATIRPMSDLKVTATIPIGKTADWVSVTAQGVWIGSTGPDAVHYIDPQTNEATTVELPGEPCAGLAADSQSLWVPLCGKTPMLAKVDLMKRALVHVLDIGPAAPEGGIAVGAGSVWLITDKQGSLVRIDPDSGEVRQTVQLPPGSFNPVFSAGRIWVTRVGGAELTVVDAATGKVLQHVPTGGKPRFLTAGGGAVWTLNQARGTLSRIDVAGRRPVVTLPLHTPGTGGDITFADGRVWTTMMKTPLTAIDAATPAVLCQWKGAGGDAIGFGYGSIWLTSYSGGTVSRISLADIPADCRAGHPAS